MSFIGGGLDNHVGVAGMMGAPNSVIGGGDHNNILTNAMSGTTHSVIGGGRLNTINPGANFAGIFAGDGNTVSGLRSVIVGGVGNNDAGLNDVVIAGTGIAAVLANTLHVNALWAGGIPFAPGGAGMLPGQIYWDVPGTPGRALYIL